MRKETSIKIRYKGIVDKIVFINKTFQRVSCRNDVPIDGVPGNGFDNDL